MGFNPTDETEFQSHKTITQKVKNCGDELKGSEIKSFIFLTQTK